MYALETIVAWAKRKAFVYPGSDIYWWLENARDYAPYGIQLKRNIEDLWRKEFVEKRADMVWLDAQILMHPKTWDASWHLTWFNDPLIDDKNTGERFRADKIIEDAIAQHGLTKDQLAEELWVENIVPESRTFEQMKAFIQTYIPKNPSSWKTAEWTDVRNFELMYYTFQGVLHDEHNKIWMRPETAQWIFVNFKNILDTTRMRLPFGIAQIGKAFRNEITPGNFLYRTREFEQMEIEYFVPEDQAEEHFTQWQEESMRFWEEKIHLWADNLRMRPHESDELSHYSKGTVDVEFNYPWGWGELQWIAWRGDFDLAQHQEFSGKSLKYTDPYTGKRFLPNIIEPSFWLSRTVLAVMFDAYQEEEYEDWNWRTQERVVVKFHKSLAPVKFAIFPLIKKDDKQTAMAKDIFDQLSDHFVCEYDESWNIGKRYRRQDEIGTPFCLTVDHQSIEDGTVTIRDRDTMQQKRISRDAIASAMMSNIFAEG